MPGIHPTACVERAAEIAEGRDIGPYCIVGPHVAIGPGCRLLAHVHVTGHTGVGAGTTIYPFASLGTPPQSSRYRGRPTRLVTRRQRDIRRGGNMNLSTDGGAGGSAVG